MIVPIPGLCVVDASTTTDVTGGDGLDTTTAFDDTESSITSVSQIGQRHHHLRHHQQQRHGGHRNRGLGDITGKVATKLDCVLV